ncbi:pyridoxamine 5'-phosphate oxidase family protein [Microbacterium sp. MEC084]|uniref:pyridoxamine 5'-phosphate oxidase family protein n=1 Tax=Microbacterium sp. MEC084 TaxID=1963027 RepID=UPI001430ACA7|nr:pyridoxamine 5'-phosphate oxidase family protein [Microbacterium sp. MEC084]MCD1267631.1 pyridoxamine 5'-phosphate oxidase family protein [Microbacterium sp. MEC084]
MIVTLSEKDCRELLRSATVGRLGFVRDGRVEIIPVSYLMHEGDVVIRTTTDGVLSALPDAEGPLAFEVDYHEPIGGIGWSVLTYGTLAVMADDEVARIPDPGRVVPWAGGTRPLHLRFAIESLSGRRVRREREHGRGD